MTKKIAVVAANGKAGQLIVKEAASRGMDVTAFVRGGNRTSAEKAVVKDIMDITAADLSGFDAVVDAFGAWTPKRSTSTRPRSRTFATASPEPIRACLS